ncbi:MAG: hypothetical protein EBU10_05430 [Alphaproteobacteria bacterium]|nr:hypothetical protein [Alphaproteobacteria bacterium]
MVMKLKYIAVAIATVSAPLAQAAGFYLKEQSIVSQGAAFAGAAARQDAASSVYFNPAGIAEMDSQIEGCLSLSRMFCPAIGVPEDPVSGNAHGLLGAYLLQHGILQREGDRASFTAAQGHFQNRPGQIDVELEFEDGGLSAVWIIGHAAQVFETTVTL